MGAHPIMQSESRSRNPFYLMRSVRQSVVGGHKMLLEIQHLSMRMKVIGSTIRLKVEILVCFAQTSVFPWRRDSCCDLVGKARWICKSFAHGVAGKAGRDSLEKRLPLETAERRIVSARSICRWYELDGPHVNGVQVSPAHPSTWRRSVLLLFDGRCDRSCGYVLG